MKYPYSSPNLTLIDLVHSLFFSKSNAEQRLKTYFSKLTGKKYILLTNSCRTALYLVYKTANIKGEVLTSPLTCSVAIDPILEAGAKPIYVDVSLGDLNIDVTDIEHRITSMTKAIQVIHFGGNSCKMDIILEIARKYGLLVIEDCAQSLGAKYKSNYTGSFGDVACFSLIKNAYGIGGGVLATNDENMYNEAHALVNGFGRVSSSLLFYRTLRAIFETKRRTLIGNFLYLSLFKLKGKRKSYKTIHSQLKQISTFEIKLSGHQINKTPKLHYKRKLLGKEYYNQLVYSGVLINNKFDFKNSSFTKMFVFNPKINSVNFINYFREKGIEVMHLEAKQRSPVQSMLVDEVHSNQKGLKNYISVHNSLISIPLIENFTLKDIKYIVEEIKTILCIKK